MINNIDYMYFRHFQSRNVNIKIPGLKINVDRLELKLFTREF